MYLAKLIIFILVLPGHLIFYPSALAAEDTKGNQQLSRTEPEDVIKEEVDPHFTGEHCDVCHEKRPRQGGATFLKYGGDYIQLCRCHNYTPGTYIHPVFIKPSEEKMARFPSDFPLENGEMTCKTCHDMYQQCEADPRLKIMKTVRDIQHRHERMFLRGGAFKHRTGICFKCHDESKYKKLDPHNQLDADGKIVTEKCLYCHRSQPDVNITVYRDVQLIGNLIVLCQRCHGLLRNHPANVNHYVQPSDKVFIRMNIMEGRYGIVLPLDDEGKLTCVTCHNPHERGVIPAERAGAKGAGEYFKHRLPGIMCSSCHGM